MFLHRINVRMECVVGGWDDVWKCECSWCVWMSCSWVSELWCSHEVVMTRGNKNSSVIDTLEMRGEVLMCIFVMKEVWHTWTHIHMNTSWTQLLPKVKKKFDSIYCLTSSSHLYTPITLLVQYCLNVIEVIEILLILFEEFFDGKEFFNTDGEVLRRIEEDVIGNTFGLN